MCQDSDNYTYFPSVTIGGPPGNYILRAPITSYENIEFSVMSFVCGLVGPSNALVSGSEITNTLDLTANTTYNDNVYLRGQLYRAGTNGSMTPTEIWERITSTQGNVYILIIGSTTSYLTIRFRAKIIRAIPAPFNTVHPQDEQQTHLERERRIEIAALGKEGELTEYGTRPARSGTVRSLQTGQSVFTQSYQGEHTANVKGNRGQ